MAGRLQRPISNPILELAWTTKMVTSTRDYSIRAGKRSEDEVGVLIDGFNEMLEQIQNRDTELRHAREDLERRVDERTTELEQEVADRQRAQEALRESEGRIRLLLDSTAEAIYGIDRDGKCTFCNPATLRLLGSREVPTTCWAKHMHDVMHHSHPDGTPYPVEECKIAKSLRPGEGIHSDEEVFWRADGTSFPVEYWAYPIRKEGETVGAVVTFLDITERKRAQAALLEAKEAAEAASRAKSEFLANMSHEIRTPMNGIIGMTELALDTALTAEQRDYLNLVKSSADSLLARHQRHSGFFQDRGGQARARRDRIRNSRFVQGHPEDAGSCGPTRRHLEICAARFARRSEMLIGDPTRLRQLVVNLVGNAIKFTEEGNIVVDTELEAGLRRRSAPAHFRFGYGHRNSTRKAAPHLRVLCPSGWLDDAPLRRNRSGADDLTPARGTDGRADLGGKRSRQGKHISFYVQLPDREARPRRTSEQNCRESPARAGCSGRGQ